MKSDKIKNIFIIILLVIIIVGGSMYFNNLIENKQTIRDQELISNASNFGYGQALQNIYDVVVKCQQIPLTFNNQTVTVIAMECLQK